MADHQPLNPVHLDKAINRFFHAISTFGFGEVWAIHTAAFRPIGMDNTEL